MSRLMSSSYLELHNTLHRNTREFPPPAPARHRWPQVEIKSLMFLINISEGVTWENIPPTKLPLSVRPSLYARYLLFSWGLPCATVARWDTDVTPPLPRCVWCHESCARCLNLLAPGSCLLLLATSAPLPTADTIFPGKNQGQLIKLSTGSTHRHRHQANIEFVNMFTLCTNLTLKELCIFQYVWS